MGKITIKESELRNMVRGAVRRQLRESFASPTLHQEIEKNGGVKKVSDGYNFVLAGIIDKLTNEDLINRALHIDDYDEKAFVECRNGKVLTIPLTYDEYNKAYDEGEARRQNRHQDDEYGEPSQVYQGAHAGKKIGDKYHTEHGRDIGMDFREAMEDLKNDYPWKNDSVARYKSGREKFRLAEDNGALNPFYEEEDFDGNTGKKGQVRSYEIGMQNTQQWEEDAKEQGATIEEYIERWFDEVNDGTLPFTWQTLGGGYGFNGETLCTFKNQITGGRVVAKDIYGQLMIDEYCPVELKESKKVSKKISVPQLKAIVKESLGKILSEGGNLYWKDDNGEAHTNSTDTWRGVDGTTYVWHGEWADPEVLYDGKEINCVDLEDNAWAFYKDECEGDGKQPSEQEFDSLPSEWFKDYLDNWYMPCAFGGGL